jgi:serine/threonine protein phosphatase PrpC
VEVAAGTTLGLRQERPSDAHLEECIAPNVTLLAVADGFGSVSRNVPTAQSAVFAVRDYLRRRHRVGSYGRNVSPNHLRGILLAALEHANARLYAESGSHEDFVGSGTSLTAVLVVGEHALVGHVGDARAYMLRLGVLESLTVDDAMFADTAVTSTSSQMLAKPRTRGLLWRTLGTQAKLEASVAHVDVRAGDQLVLCTDGVHRFIDDDEIGEALFEASDCASAVARVLATAKARGTLEGGTLIVCRDLLRSASVVLVGAPRYAVRTVVAVSLLVLALLSFGSYVFHANSLDRLPNVSNSDRP